MGVVFIFEAPSVRVNSYLMREFDYLARSCETRALFALVRAQILRITSIGMRMCLDVRCVCVCFIYMYFFEGVCLGCLGFRGAEAIEGAGFGLSNIGCFKIFYGKD